MPARFAKPTLASVACARVVRRADAGRAQRQGDVLERRDARQQIEELEHDADARAAEIGERVVAEGRQRHPVEEDLPRSRIEPGDEVQQRALPEPLGPMSATNSPRAIVSDTPFTASTRRAPWG
jgi:hypothetical protein